MVIFGTNSDGQQPSLIPTKRKRAANACIRCRTRKQRCEGLSIPCLSCAKTGSMCTFPEDASGERLLREHVAKLEIRIEELTRVIQQIDPFHSILTTTTNQIDQSEHDEEEELVNRIGSLSLTSGAEPLYLGGSSGASWGRIFSAALRRNSPSPIPRQSTLSSEPYTLLNTSSSHEVIHRSSYPPPPPPTTTTTTTQSSSDLLLSSSSKSLLRPRFLFPQLSSLDSISDELYETVYSTIQSRHCFMNFAILKFWYDRRYQICSVLPHPTDLLDDDEVESQHDHHHLDGLNRTGAFFIWLAYALGLRLWEGQGRCMKGLPSYEHCFQAALQYFGYIDSNTTTIQALLFLAMFSFRSDKGLSVWHLGGLAMRTALELGLHKKTTSKLKRAQHQDGKVGGDLFNEEMRKRVWWDVYCLDRTMALQLGRPIAIQDREIEIELPLDIDCHITDPDEILSRRSNIEQELQRTRSNLETNPYPLGYTSMSPALHHIRLRQILTNVKETVYHHHHPSDQKNHHHASSSDQDHQKDLDRLTLKLENWRRQIPIMRKSVSTDHNLNNESDDNKEHSRSQQRKVWKPVGMPFYSSEWFDLQYHNAIQTLLIPYALTAPPGDPYLRRAASSAIRSCQLQKDRVQRGSLAPLSIYSLHKLFMSGVFLLYALDRDPGMSIGKGINQPSEFKGEEVEKEDEKERIDEFGKRTSRMGSMGRAAEQSIRSCREVLVVYAAHYPRVQMDVECFERLVKSAEEKAIRRQEEEDATRRQEEKALRIQEEVTRRQEEEALRRHEGEVTRRRVHLHEYHESSRQVLRNKQSSTSCLLPDGMLSGSIESLRSEEVEHQIEMRIPSNHLCSGQQDHPRTSSIDREEFVENDHYSQRNVHEDHRDEIFGTSQIVYEFHHPPMSLGLSNSIVKGDPSYSPLFTIVPPKGDFTLIDQENHEIRSTGQPVTNRYFGSTFEIIPEKRGMNDFPSEGFDFRFLLPDRFDERLPGGSGHENEEKQQQQQQMEACVEQGMNMVDLLSEKYPESPRTFDSRQAIIPTNSFGTLFGFPGSSLSLNDPRGMSILPSFDLNEGEGEIKEVKKPSNEKLSRIEGYPSYSESDRSMLEVYLNEGDRHPVDRHPAFAWIESDQPIDTHRFMGHNSSGESFR